MADRRELAIWLVSKCSSLSGGGFAARTSGSICTKGRHPALYRGSKTRGKHVFRRGDLGNALYLVVSGASKSVSTCTTKSRLVGLLPGTVFGELALLRGGIRSADALVASGEAELLVLTGLTLERIKQKCPGVAHKFFRNIANLMSGCIASTSEDLCYALSSRY
jgi:CRP-like cAMP-binding protein